MTNDSAHPLRAFRDRQKLTLQGLSDLLGEPRIAPSTLAYYESGKRIPRRTHMGRLVALTGIAAGAFYDFPAEAAE